MNADETSQPLSDEALFARIASGDSAAFGVFYDRHASLLLGISWKITGQMSDAEDVLQEACAIIWERAPTYDPSGGKPLSWAATITRNRAIDRIRSTQRKASLLTELTPEHHEKLAGIAPQPSQGNRDVGDLLRKAVEELGVDQRAAIELAFFGGLTQTEIAEHLGQPLGTIKARIRRGMLTLRDALEGVL